MKRDAFDDLIDYRDFCAELKQNRASFDRFYLSCIVIVAFMFGGAWLACMNMETQPQTRYAPHRHTAISSVPSTGGEVATR